MSEAITEYAIKLFGKTIALSPPDKVFSDITVTEQTQSSSYASTSQHIKAVSAKEFKTNKHQREPIDPSESATSSDSSSENSLEKPENLLPCPRCKSNDTKFCYYNNYNVKQPRHFCKSCQRYWTIGGTTRNVPVGSGRRKNKNAALVPSYHNLMLLDSLQETRPDPANNFLIFGTQNRGPNGFIEHLGRSFSPSAFPIAFYPASMCNWGSSLLSEENASKRIRAERTSPVLIPKALRIDDPKEAAKSSIWSTLGIENGKFGSTNKTCHFEVFETKGDRDRTVDSATMALRANPAALSRSINFHESA